MPAAPAPAPAAPPAAAPSPAPAPTPASPPAQVKPPPGGASDTPPKPQSYVDEYEAAIDDLDDSNRNRDPKPPRTNARARQQQQDDDAPPPEPAPEPEPPKPGDKKVEEPVEHDLDGPEPIRVVELRTAYRQLKKQIKDQLRPEVTKLQGRIKELEQGSGANTELQTQLEGIKKRNDELEREINFTNYARSRDFQENYAKPYLEAWNSAISDFNQLKVRVPGPINPETGEPTFSTRQATADDLLLLANMSDLTEMDDKAEQMFGRSFPRVVRHIEKVRELALKQEKALADARNHSVERKTLTEAQTKAAIEKGEKMWVEENKRIVDKYPTFFGPRQGDDEGNALLTKGREMADKVFVTSKRPKTAEEMLKINALAYNKIANHDRLAVRLKQANARLRELQKIVDEYEESEPAAGKAGRGEGRGTSPGNYMDEANKEIDALDK